MKKTFFIIALTVLMVCGGTCKKATAQEFSVDFKPNSGSGLSYSGTVKVSIREDHNIKKNMDEFVNITVNAKVTPTSDMVYVFESKKYTASDLGMPRFSSWLWGGCEIGVSYGNGTVIWVPYSFATPPAPGEDKVSLSDLGITLPKVVPITEKLLPGNTAAYYKNKEEHDKSVEKHSEAYKEAIKKIRVQIRNCYGGKDKNIENKIKLSLIF